MGVFAGGRESERRSFLKDPDDLWCWPSENKNFRNEEFEISQFADIIVILSCTDICIQIFGVSK